MTNKSVWINFRAVTSQNWSYPNVVLLGDALGKGARYPEEVECWTAR
jgi:hypothetical protein